MPKGRPKKTWLERNRTDLIGIMIEPFMENHEVFDPDFVKEFMDKQFDKCCTDFLSALGCIVYFYSDYNGENGRWGDRHFYLEKWEIGLIQRFFMEAHGLDHEQAKELLSWDYGFYYAWGAFIEGFSSSYDSDRKKRGDELLRVCSPDLSDWIKNNLLNPKLSSTTLYAKSRTLGMYVFFKEVPINPLGWLDLVEFIKSYRPKGESEGLVSDEDLEQVEKFIQEKINGK